MKKFTLFATIVIGLGFLCWFIIESHRITRILDAEWNPYGVSEASEHWVGHKKHGRIFAWYVLVKNPTEDELIDYICTQEIDMNLGPHKKRASIVATKILDGRYFSKKVAEPETAREELD